MSAGRVKLPFSALLRIGARDGWACHICGFGYSAADPWEIDHARSLAEGGTNHEGNLRLAHKTCNREKGALSMQGDTT